MIILSFTAGTAFIMWIGEQINESGIGNGISLIIFAGIVARGPQAVRLLFMYTQQWTLTKNIIVSLAATVGVIFGFRFDYYAGGFRPNGRTANSDLRQRSSDAKCTAVKDTYLPIKVNQAGVLPVISISIISLPPTIVNLFGSTGPVAKWLANFTGNPFYYILYALLIIGFTFFYSMIQFNPIEWPTISKKAEFIPGYRPGRATSDFIHKTSKRLTWFDAIFLVLIVLFPAFMSAVTGAQGIWFGGTAILILVGVAIDLVDQLEAQMVMRHYKGFLVISGFVCGNEGVRPGMANALVTIRRRNSSMNIVLLGPPGSGKGIGRRPHSSVQFFEYVSTGDIFRHNIRKRPPWELNASEYIHAGQLVPDHVTIAMPPIT